MAPFEEIDLTSAAFKEEPFPFYERLLSQTPVCRVRLPDRSEAWIVARYEDVQTVLKDPRLVKDRANAGLKGGPRLPRPLAPLMRSMLDLDDPDHARLKRLAQVAFTPRRVESMAVRVEELAHGLLDRAGPQFDAIADFALPLPVALIAELLGVPPQDRGRFVRWSQAFLQNSTAPLDVLRAVPSMLAFVGYLRRLVRLRREEPTDDLTSALVAATDHEGTLSEDELIAMMALLLTAGFETTVNLIGNGALALLRHQEQRERFVAEPNLAPSAVEELLRFDSPVYMTSPRYVREELEIAGVAIPVGSKVHGLIAAANRDPRQFPDPAALDLARRPNRHLAFGQGGHYCVGAPLARLEGSIALRALFERRPNVRLQPGPIHRRRGLLLNGLQSLLIDG